jgi:small-conductance mechanosensitive channel
MPELLRSFFHTLAGSLRDLVGHVEWSMILAWSVAALFTTLVFFLFVRLNSWVARKLERRIEARQGTKHWELKFQAQEILSEEEVIRILGGAIRLVRLVILLTLCYLYLQFIFSLLPWTHGVATLLVEATRDAVVAVVLAISGYLPSLILIIFILMIARYLVKLSRIIFNGIHMGRIRLRGFYREWALPTFNIARFLIIVFALIVVFPYLPGSGSAAFQGVSIFVGLLISLGSTVAVANVVAGVVMTYMRAFRIGDHVKIADAVGDVVEKTLLVTRIRTPKNVEVAIPNGLVLTNPIVNFTSQAREEGLVLHTAVTIGYDVPWADVHETLIEAARATEGIEATPDPFVLQTSLDDFYVRYEINAYTRHAGRMAATYSRLHQQIQDRFHQAGIEILSPHYTSVGDGNRAAVPSDYLPRDYRTPGFRVHPLEGLLGGGPVKKSSGGN